MVISLPLVFALFDFFEDGKARFFGIRNGQRLELVRRAEAGNNFANGLFARRALGQFRRAQGPLQRELAAADRASALAQFIFVKWHQNNVQRVSSNVE